VNFDSLIVAPITAVMDASVKSAEECVRFIKKFGFENMTGNNSGELAVMSFTYEKLTWDDKKEETTIYLPLLILMPIPYVRLDTLSVEFNVAIESGYRKAKTMSASMHAGMELETKSGQTSFNFGARVSGSLSTHKEVKVDKNYGMNLTVQVRSLAPTEKPMGLSKLVEMMQVVISQQMDFPEERPKEEKEEQ